MNINAGLRPPSIYKVISEISCLQGSVGGRKSPCSLVALEEVVLQKLYLTGTGLVLA